MASSAGFTRGSGAVVDVFATVMALPAIDTNALVAAVFVDTGCPILANIGPLHALVDVVITVGAGEARRTSASIVVGAFDAGTAVLA